MRFRPQIKKAPLEVLFKFGPKLDNLKQKAKKLGDGAPSGP